jgi:hypothetical protein
MSSSLKEITPPHLRCGSGTCPAIFEAEDGSLVIIGKRLPKDWLNKIAHRVGEGEDAVIIQADLLANL